MKKLGLGLGLSTAGLIALLGGCSSKDTQEWDSSTQPTDDMLVQGDTGDGALHPHGDGTLPSKHDGTTNPTKDSGNATGYKVAAIQYTSGQESQVLSSCTSDSMPDVCAVQEMIKQAHAKGATFAVTPEYGLGQTAYESSPAIGSNPGTSGGSDSILSRFSKQAKSLSMYITIDLLTTASSKHYNTAVSFDSSGKVLDVHYKYNLYGESSLTAGTDVTVFTTPLGVTASLICADIQSSTYETLRKKLQTTLKARVVMLPAMWGPNPGNTYFKAFAKKYGFYVAASNTTTATGNGGGIFTPTGGVLDSTTSTSPATVIGLIPKP
jgi:predicted amidohydrolase